GGGHCLTLCSLLVQHPHLRGTVLERPHVLPQPDAFWAAKLGVSDRCTYVAGDMFHAVPPADAYMMKRILHNWNDAECDQILATLHRAAPQHGRVLIIEHIVPGPDTPHVAKLFDLHMLILLTGRERTLEEYTRLLAGAGWTYRQTWYPASKRLGVVEAVKAQHARRRTTRGHTRARLYPFHSTMFLSGHTSLSITGAAQGRAVAWPRTDQS